MNSSNNKNSGSMIQKALGNLGYRYDTPSHQDLIDEAEKDIRKYTPVCTYFDCCHEGDVKEIEKHVTEKWQRRCPDCGHTLTWKKLTRLTGKAWIIK